MPSVCAVCVLFHWPSIGIMLVLLYIHTRHTHTLILTMSPTTQWERRQETIARHIIKFDINYEIQSNPIQSEIWNSRASKKWQGRERDDFYNGNRKLVLLKIHFGIHTQRMPHSLRICLCVNVERHKIHN